MNWYHRAEQRYVEYGSLVRGDPRVRALPLALRHRLQHEHGPPLRRGGDRLRAPRRRRRAHRVHAVSDLPRPHAATSSASRGCCDGVALAATLPPRRLGPGGALLRRALLAARKVACKPTLGAPGTRDEYSACVGRELVEHDLYDFLLFSLPDNDYHSHRTAPTRSPSRSRAPTSARRARRRRRRDRPVPRRARRDRGRRPLADPGRRAAEPRRRRSADVAGAAAERRPTRREAELAVCPSCARGAGLRARGRAAPRARCTPGSATACASSTASTCSPGSGTRRRRCAAAMPTARRRAAARRWSSATARSCGFGRAAQVTDRRGVGWDLDGDPATLDGDRRRRRARSPTSTRMGSRGSGRRSTRPTPARS